MNDQEKLKTVKKKCRVIGIRPKYFNILYGGGDAKAFKVFAYWNSPLHLEVGHHRLGG